MPAASNPWGLRARHAHALDCYVLAGDRQAAAKMFGVTEREFSGIVRRALEKIPGEQRLHKLIAWRDHRCLLPDAVPPATVARYFRPSTRRKSWTCGVRA